jgi:hypothetical protein
MNTLPVIYANMKPTPRNLKSFRLAACLAVLVCFALNVVWCLFVLQVVPQTSPDPDSPSLERSRKLQDPGFVPLIEIIKKSFPQYNWLSIIVQVFIALSVSVSFVTMSSGMKHILDGHVTTFEQHQMEPNSYAQKLTRFLVKGKKVLFFLRNEHKANRRVAYLIQYSLYFIMFSLVLIAAQVNYKGFLSVMEIFTSFGLNLESGVFVCYMLWVSRHKKFQHTKIPVPLSKLMVFSLWFIGAYFIFAMLWDVVYHILVWSMNTVPF